MFYKTLLESAVAAPRRHGIKPRTTPSHTRTVRQLHRLRSHQTLKARSNYTKPARVQPRRIYGISW